MGLNYPPEGAVESRFPPEQRRVCTGKAGTLVFCDTTGFHKGGHATGKGRYLFNAVYTTNAGPSTRARQYYLKGLPAAHLQPPAEYAVGHLEGLS
jgi:hypothetical protein